MARFYRSSTSARGTKNEPKCDGTLKTTQSGLATAFLGQKKSAIVKSDRVKPTQYETCWIDTSSFGLGGSSQNGALCIVPGSNPPEYFYLRITSKIPFALSTSAISLPGFSTMTVGSTSPNQPTVNFSYMALNAIADNALLGKIKDEKFSLGVALGEAKETANLLLDLTEDLLSMVDFVRRGRKDPFGFAKWLISDKKGREIMNGKNHWRSYEKKYKSHPHLKGGYKNRSFSKRELSILGFATSTAANRWMQYRYGMIPTYNDILKLFDIAIAQAGTEPIISSRVTIPFPKTTAVSGTVGGYAVTKSKVIGRHQVKVWYRVSKPVSRSRSQWGMSFLDIPSIIYELTPFSWMLDWVWPVGETLSVLSATRGLVFSHGYRSQFCEVDMEANFNPYPTTGVTAGPIDPLKAKYGAFSRTPLSEFPLPSFPSLQNPFGYHTGQRIADVLSLIRQNINFK